MKKIMLIYPAGEIYQRGEERCQINVEFSSANSQRACNDLGIAAQILRTEYDVFLRDYQIEKCNIEDLKQDVLKENPDIIFISITNGSILYDLKTVNLIKNLKEDLVVILKGALFFNPDKNLFNEIDLKNVDYLIGGEFEFIIKQLINAHFNNKNLLKDIEGICYKKEEKWVSNPVKYFNENLDEIVFPARDLMRNELYINPAVNKPMATISISRGCPSSCIYCLSPVISGKKARYRSAQNILQELTECVEKYNITEFFFKSDTFTINKQRVIELCNLIIKSPLKGKIKWCANTRADSTDEEIILKMKEAGCTLIAIGLESGSNDSLKKMKKGTTKEQNIKAVKLIKSKKIAIFGFYLIGFPWEDESHLKETEKLIFELDTDFIEISIATPFKGSELYKMTMINQVEGKDSFKNITQGTNYLSKKQLIDFRKRVILKYYFRKEFIKKKLKNITLPILKNYVKYALRLIKNNMF